MLTSLVDMQLLSCVLQMYVCMQLLFAEGLTAGHSSGRVPGAVYAIDWTQIAPIFEKFRNGRPCRGLGKLSTQTPEAENRSFTPSLQSSMQSIRPSHA